MLVAINVDADRDVADTAIGIQNAVVDLTAIVPISGCQGLLDLGADDSQIVRIDEALSILGRRELIAALLLGGGVEDRIELIVEVE